MKVAFDILKRDLLALVKNPIALIVVLALLVLPGLYAWYCIIANWDPYAHTGNMPIAVVNKDKGAKNDLAGEVNIGEQVTDKLKDNDSIDWRFYDDEEAALADTKTLVVYAAIVLPDDLSENVVGILEGSDEKPTVYYYPNEKKSAVATKVTDSAAQTLIQQINQGFSSTVNQKILESTKKTSDEIEAKADQANNSAMAEIKDVQADLDKVVASLGEASGIMAGWRNAAQGADVSLAATAEQLPAIRTMLDQAGAQLNSLRSQTDDFEGKLSASILKSASTIAELSGNAVTVLNNAMTDLKAVQSDLEAAEEAAGSDAALKLAIEGLELAVSLIQDVVNGVDSRVTEMDAAVQAVTNNVTTATNRISNEVMPQMDAGSYELALSFSMMSGAVGQFEPQITGLRSVLAQTDSALASATVSISDAQTLLGVISSDLKSTVSDIGTIGSAVEIDRLSRLLEIDPDNLGTFISTPVQMVTEKICPVSNYGTAVTPFYTNLALWVGCFILVSVMRVEVAGFPEATARQRYFGRWLLFVILSLIQSQVICGVDILLGIDCANPVLFMLAGAVCSFAYMNLIYAFVKTFRNVGKTLCILLLIMQVPGSSGMYPIQMVPGFFQFIHPTLPFTYGIDAMREALCGMYGLAYLKDLFVLALIVPIALVIGLLLRPLMANLLMMFDDEMGKTGFFISEEHGRGPESNRVRSMVRALATHDSYADEIEERAWRFNRMYPRLRKVGTSAMYAIPFAFLLLMLLLNVAFDLSPDVKINALVAMIVLLLVVFLALVLLEYMNRVISEETKLLGASILGADWDADLAVSKDSAAEKPEEAEEKLATGMIPAAEGLTARPPHRGPARDIFIVDLTLGFQSVVGAVVIMLLVITPSMYAWFNIDASWDPYANTGHLKVAVANEDEGYKGELVPVTINIGDTVVSQLRGNDSFDWVFVDKEEAVAGVESSKYYAAVEIPADFSTNMMTYLIEDADYPNVVYYTNEKENPIAPIITQKGASSVQEGIRVSFTERIDQVVLGVAYDVLEYVSNPRMSDYVVTMDKHLDDATHNTTSAAREIRTVAGLVKTTSSIVDALGATLDGLKAAGDTAKAAIANARSGASNASSAFEQAVAIVQEMLDGHVIDVDKLQTIIDTALTILEAGADEVPGIIQERIDRLEELGKDATGDLKAAIEAVIRRLEIAKAHAQAAADDIGLAREKTDALIADAQSDVAEARAYFDNTVKASIDELRSSLSQATSSTAEIADGLDVALTNLGGSTGGLSSQLTMLADSLVKSGDKLESSAKRVEDTKNRVADALKSGDLKKIEDVILGGDPETMAASLVAPLQLHREALYPVSNFGSSMAPFYTVLSLWVGALVLVSTMSVHIAKERLEELRRRYAKVLPRHEFFGRYGIFGLIGLLQSSLVLLGDLMFLHIQCDNPVLFFVFGVLIGQAFCLIVYTMAELFGDVGKALCVILLIMQVAASGGTFPVQMLDPLLENIVPFLPFYHAMSLLQECVAGVYWPAVFVSIAALAVMVGVMLIIGLPFRRPFHKLNTFFEEQLEKTGYM